MSILPRLENNKGTVSSALGKDLARIVLDGDTSILQEAVLLLGHENKQVRAGAAKIIEQVALERPGLVVCYLPRLLPALESPEPQTRWMVIHTLGLCAELDLETALSAMPMARIWLSQESGACLWGATICYLGYLGGTSAENAQRVFPLLEEALDKIPKQAKQVLDAFLQMVDQAELTQRKLIAVHADRFVKDDRSSVRNVARKLRKLALPVTRKADRIPG